MRIKQPIDSIRIRLLDQRGVTMIIAMGVMLVTSLLLVGAYASANGDVHNSHVDRRAEAGLLRRTRRHPGI